MSRKGIDKTSQDYIDGANEERARIAARDARRAALDAHPSLPDLASEVAKHLGRDHGRKQRILQRSPHVFAAMDADEVGQASSRELAARELKDLGIDVGDSDPVQLLDAHHAGRQWARDQMSAGGRRSASDAREGGESFLSKYLES